VARVGDPSVGAAEGLRDLDLARGYDSADEALRRFYVPALGVAKQYDRSVGYFRASSLAVAARGLSRFIAGGGTARFLIGAEVGEADRAALVGAVHIPKEFAERLATELVPEDEIARRRLEVLAWLLQEKRLEIRVAIAVDDEGVPLPAGEAIPYFHEKIGVLRDARGDGVAFQGSINESGKAWVRNFESFSVYFSWDASAPYFDQWAQKFEARWAGHVKGFRVFALPDALHDELLAFAPSEPPDERDPEEAPTPSDARALGRFLHVAPRLVGAQALAEATSAVTLFPHQRKVVERLAGEYPRSWLVADEVGLGKTISAGLALRRLLLAGDVARVLILAPANVCRQWQDELFEKFGLWVPRLVAGAYHGAHPDDVTPVAPGANPYVEPPVLLVSSHLARRREHRAQILAAPPYDLVIVDEAHHARRRAADLDEYRPSRLLELLDEIADQGHARSVWFMTATPMQVHAVELWDLLRHFGLPAPFGSYRGFARFHEELVKPVDRIDWAMLHRSLQLLPTHAVDPASDALVERLRAKLGVVDADRIRRFGRAGEDPSALVEPLSAAGKAELREWVRHRSPIGQYVTRHTRQTLKRYRAAGLLREPIADRDVEAVPVPFTRAEQDLYDRLDDLLDRLMAAHGTKRGAGFVLTVYRRRLTSSWAAITSTLKRRLNREGLLLDADWLDEPEIEAEELETDDGRTIDDTAVLPLSLDDIAEIERYLDDLERVPDSKFDRLSADLAAARARGAAVIVFTQFTDTLESLRDRLVGAYRSHLATYSGEGGRIWTEDEGWVAVTKQELVDALQSGRVSVILATDAASEGLNLQVASHLVNYDLPWNPMRVEQRIGRIDRIGQAAPIVTIRNYVVPGTVEEQVYAVLADRIDLFAGLVGRLQPILGATEAAFRAIFQAPRSERAAVADRAIADLLAQVDQLDASGIDLADEDPLPVPVHGPAPVTLAQLEEAADRLGLSFETPGRPATFAAGRVTRDPERWCALATYGHPRVDASLAQYADAGDRGGPVVIAQVGAKAIAYRADRTPPERLSSVTELFEPLGPPVAAGDAWARATDEAKRAEEEWRARLDLLASANRSLWEHGIKRRFRQLVARAVQAEQLLYRHAEGELKDAHLVWAELQGDTRTAWKHADLFRQHLRMEVADLLPGPPGADDRTDRDLAAVRGSTGKELSTLIEEWKRIALGEDHG
jgi:hypothetical protein